MITNVSQIVYLTYPQAQDLVERIAARTIEFNLEMSTKEKEAMASLLSDIGVKVDDLIDPSFLADNYAINAEIVEPSDYKNYDMPKVKENYLFQWEENGETYYCLSW